MGEREPGAGIMIHDLIGVWSRREEHDGDKEQEHGAGRGPGARRRSGGKERRA
jgi:hypothetical protein